MTIPSNRFKISDPRRYQAYLDRFDLDDAGKVALHQAVLHIANMFIDRAFSSQRSGDLTCGKLGNSLAENHTSESGRVSLDQSHAEE